MVSDPHPHQPNPPVTKDLEAMRKIVAALEDLTHDGKTRVIKAISILFRIDL